MTYTFLRDNFYADFSMALPDGGPHRACRRRAMAWSRAELRRPPGPTRASRIRPLTGRRPSPSTGSRSLTRVWVRPSRTCAKPSRRRTNRARGGWPPSGITTRGCRPLRRARGEMDVVSTTVRDVTGRGPYLRRSPELTLASRAADCMRLWPLNGFASFSGTQAGVASCERHPTGRCAVPSHLMPAHLFTYASRPLLASCHGT